MKVALLYKEVVGRGGGGSGTIKMAINEKRKLIS